MRIEAGNREPGLGQAEPGFQIRDHDVRGRDDQFRRKPRDRLTQRNMDGHGHNSEGRRPQHHHRLRRLAPACREFGEKLGMAGMPETRVVEHAFCNRIGNNSTGSTRRCFSNSLTNGGDGRIRAGMVGPAGLRCRTAANTYDRQRIREHVRSIFGANVCGPHLDPESPCAPIQKITIAKQIERWELQLFPAQPGLKSDVGSYTCGFA